MNNTRIGWLFQSELLCDGCLEQRVDAAGIDPGLFPNRVEKPTRSFGLEVDSGMDHALFDLAADIGVDFTDESTYDSDDFPKSYFVSNVREDGEVRADCNGCGKVLFTMDELDSPLDPTLVRFNAMLDQFKQVTRSMATEWESGDIPGDAVDNYPPYLPSFGEFSADVDEMKVRGFDA